MYYEFNSFVKCDLIVKLCRKNYFYHPVILPSGMARTH